MKAELLIKNFKKDMNKLIMGHEEYQKTNGEVGSVCLNPEKLYSMLEWSDEQILDYLEEQFAYYIIDKEEYLSNKKEKTN